MLHFKNEFTLFEISVLWYKGSSAFMITMSGECPSVCVEVRAIEIIFPTQLELILSILNAQVVISLNVLVASVPWHVRIICKMISAPIRRPKVHDYMLLLVQVLHSLMWIFFQMNFFSAFNAVDDEGDVIRRPPDIIIVPVVGWVEILDILPLVGEVSPDQVGVDFVKVMRN